MGSKTKIKWWDSTWNPIVGCSPISNGCINCYARRIVKRFTTITGISLGPELEPIGWDGRAHFMPYKLEQPLHWRKPRRIFVCSMGDLFHSSITNEQIASVFGVMAACSQHTFIILTKRPGRAVEWFKFSWFDSLSVNRIMPGNRELIACCKGATSNGMTPNLVGYDTIGGIKHGCTWPLTNVWLGVSVEDQKTADDRIPKLLEIPVAKRFVSVEPMLKEMDLQYQRGWLEPFVETDPMLNKTPRVDWIIVGAETGPHKRPMNIDWARSLRDQCIEANVPFFFKKDGFGRHELDGQIWEQFPK